MIKPDRLFLTLALAAASMGCSAAGATGTTGTGGEGGSAAQTTGIGGQGSATTTGAGGSATGGSGGAGQGGAGGQGTGGQGTGGQGTGGFMQGCGPVNGEVLAFTKIFYGDTNPDDTPNKVNGWKQYGFNLDGKVSDQSSVDLCQPANNTPPKNVYPDGDNGIDNSFGRNLLPIYLGLASDFSVKANQSISDGLFTVMLHLEGLMAGDTQGPLVTKLYSGTPLGAPAKFDGTDCWPVAPEQLANPVDIASSKVAFDMSSVALNHWVSGGEGTVFLTFSFAGAPMTLTIHHARLTMDLAPDHKSASAGQLGGVLDTQEFTTEIKKAVGAFDQSLCSGPTIDSIIAQITSASDIMNDGTQDPAKVCNGISIGLGFKMKAVQFGLIGPPAVVLPSPCP